MDIAAIITASSIALVAILGVLGKAMHYIVTLLLDAYKRQSEATIAAKDRDLSAKDRDLLVKDAVIAKQDTEISRLHLMIERVTDLRVRLQDTDR